MLTVMVTMVMVVVVGLVAGTRGASLVSFRRVTSQLSSIPGRHDKQLALAVPTYVSHDATVVLCSFGHPDRGTVEFIQQMHFT